MSKSNFSDDFKRDAVAQITERGYPVSEVSQRPAIFLGAMPAAYSLCQRRSKIRPLGRSKTRPLDVMRYAVLRVVPVVHRRDPRCFV
jgi:transposase